MTRASPERSRRFRLTSRGLLILGLVIGLGAGAGLLSHGPQAQAGPPPPSEPRSWAQGDYRKAPQDQIVRGMARFSLLCGLPLGTPLISGMVMRAANSPLLSPHEATLLACVLGAPKEATCEQIGECTGGPIPPPTQPYCDGDLLRSWVRKTGSKTEKQQAAVSCRALGGSCFQSPAGGFCGEGPCQPGETYACDGNDIVSCMEGIRVRSPCGRGTVCGQTPGSHVIDCVGSGKTCKGGGRCDGDTLYQCSRDSFGGGQEMALPCADFGLTCTQGTGQGKLPIALCIAPPAAGTGGCTDETPPVCEGGLLKFCVNHRLVSLACAELGFDGSCVPSPDDTKVKCQ